MSGNREFRADRLIRLAEHLERGQLFHDQFNFARLSERNICGTAGCALGEAEVLFNGKKPGFVNAFDDLGNSLVAGNFFGVTAREIEHLFWPANDSCPLEKNATKYEVAAHIRAFVERKLAELDATSNSASCKTDGARLAREEMVGV